MVLGAALLLAARGLAEEAAEISLLGAYQPDDRKMAEEILGHSTFRADRRMRFSADPAVFEFLVDHPDFSATVHRGLGLDEFQVREEGQRFLITHGYARGTFWVAERRADRVAYLATGTYEHPLLRAAGIRLQARSLVFESVTLDSTQAPTTGLRVHLHAHLQIENPVLGSVLRWFSPLIRGAFESKLTAAYQIAPSLSEVALRDRERFLERVRQIRGLDPGLLDQFEGLVRAQPCVPACSPTEAGRGNAKIGKGGAPAPRLSRTVFNFLTSS